MSESHVNRSRNATLNGLGGLRKALWLLGRIAFRDLRIRAGLAPQDDLVAPGVGESVIEAVEGRPVVIAPEDRGAARHRALQDGVHGFVVADQDPDAWLSAAFAQRTRRCAGRLGVGPGVIGLKMPRCRLP